MPCKWIDLPGGGVAHVRMGRARTKRCGFCTHGYAEKLCDFPVGPGGKTCDAGICLRCATEVKREHGDSVDFCPNHKNQVPAQGGLAL